MSDILDSWLACSGKARYLLGGALAIFLNGVGVVKLQVLQAIAFCIIAIPLKFILSQQLGLEGLIPVNIFAYIAAFAIPYVLLFRHQLFRCIY